VYVKKSVNWYTICRKVWASWRWARTEAETYQSNN